MMWLKWFPWRFIVRRVAGAHGFLDPIALLARLRPKLVITPDRLPQHEAKYVVMTKDVP